MGGGGGKRGRDQARIQKQGKKACQKRVMERVGESEWGGVEGWHS